MAKKNNRKSKEKQWRERPFKMRNEKMRKWDEKEEFILLFKKHEIVSFQLIDISGTGGTIPIQWNKK